MLRSNLDPAFRIYIIYHYRKFCDLGSWIKFWYLLNILTFIFTFKERELVSWKYFWHISLIKLLCFCFFLETIDGANFCGYNPQKTVYLSWLFTSFIIAFCFNIHSENHQPHCSLHWSKKHWLTVDHMNKNCLCCNE